MKWRNKPNSQTSGSPKSYVPKQHGDVSRGGEPLLKEINDAVLCCSV